MVVEGWIIMIKLMALHRSLSCFTLYMNLLSYVQKGWVNEDVGFYIWNLFTNHYCADIVFSLNSCRTVDLCVSWVCWFCLVLVSGVVSKFLIVVMMIWLNGW